MTRSKASDANGTNTPDKATANGAPKADPLGRTVGYGVTWMGLSTAVGKAASFLAQVVLGALLLQEDFGIFAIAISVATFVKVFLDGGVPQLLVQLGPRRYDELAGPAFWIGMTFSLGTAVVLAALAPIVSHLYGQPELLELLLIIALSLPLGAPASLLRAKLRLDLRFRTLSLISMTSAFVRHTSAVTLALMGYGAKSFVIPMVLVVIFECLATFLATRSTPWLHPASVHRWTSLLTSSIWIVLATFFRSFALNGDYVVLGLLVPASALGQYFFGYQLTFQIALLLAGNLQIVLFPVMSRLTEEPDRQAEAIIRSIRVLLLVAAPLSLGLAVTIGPLERLIWGGKWASAVPLMQIFSVVGPLRMVPPVIHAALAARGRFRASASLMLAQGGLLMAAAGVAAYLAAPDITAIAFIIAAYQAVFSISMSALVLRSFAVGPLRVLGAALPTWGVAVAVAAFVLGATEILPIAVHPATQILVIGSAFAVLFLASTRILFQEYLLELMRVVPRPVGRVLRRVLALEERKHRS